MERVLAIKNHEGLCWKCLQSFDKSQIHIIKIHEMGYGSAFDGERTELHLCDECYQDSIKDNKELWSMEETSCEWDEDRHGFTEYKYETEMLDYIDNLPLQGKQFVKNEFNSDGWRMEPQDWIDYKLDILPHEKCKEYWLYSPEEIKAYSDRFTTCEYPTNRIWDDNSKGCQCPLGSMGNYNQTIDSNISSECYECKYYKPRVTPIKDISSDDFEDYMEYLRLTIKQEELKKRFEQ